MERKGRGWCVTQLTLGHDGVDGDEPETTRGSSQLGVASGPRSRCSRGRRRGRGGRSRGHGVACNEEGDGEELDGPLHGSRRVRDDVDGYPELELLLARVMVGRATARRVETYLAAARSREGRKWTRGTRARSRTPYIGARGVGWPSNHQPC